MPWDPILNIRGPQGIQGIQGPKGDPRIVFAHNNASGAGTPLLVNHEYSHYHNAGTRSLPTNAAIGDRIALINHAGTWPISSPTITFPAGQEVLWDGVVVASPLVLDMNVNRVEFICFFKPSGTTNQWVLIIS